MKSPNPNSKRYKRRLNRDFKGSRPNRRAEQRLKSALKSYELALAASKGHDAGLRKPGAIKRW